MNYNLIFCDQNANLCKKVFELKKCVVINDDIFVYENEHGGLIATASNPNFTMGGGLDAAIKKRFRNDCSNLWHGKTTHNLLGIVSVNDELTATPEIIKHALKTIVRVSDTRKVIFTGIGTGIGGLPEDKFIQILDEVLSSADNENIRKN